jgi:hypothetical protein
MYLYKRRKTPDRKALMELKPNDRVFVRLPAIFNDVNTIEQVLVINNDPATHKLLIEIEWADRDERIVVHYGHLKDFALMNPKGFVYDIPTLKRKIEDAVKCDDYEKAAEYQKDIDRQINESKK